MKIKTKTLFRLCIRLAHALCGFWRLEPKWLEVRERISKYGPLRLLYLLLYAEVDLNLDAVHRRCQ